MRVIRFSLDCVRDFKLKYLFLSKDCHVPSLFSKFTIHLLKRHMGLMFSHELIDRCVITHRPLLLKLSLAKSLFCERSQSVYRIFSLFQSVSHFVFSKFVYFTMQLDIHYIQVHSKYYKFKKPIHFEMDGVLCI